MSLLEDFRVTLKRLSTGGWEPIFSGLGVDPFESDLRTALQRPLVNVDKVRTWPGFEEVAQQALRPIEQGKPAASLLFHALASPSVQTVPSGELLEIFPTAAELELAENLVYGINPPAIADLKRVYSGSHFAVCVFAKEYRQSHGTVHGSHADMIFSRTGITRVGTLAPLWDGRVRAFVPHAENDDIFSFRVLPCRYAVYLAVQKLGDPRTFGPFRFDRGLVVSNEPTQGISDEKQYFWVPIHKLFSGPECLLNTDLTVNFKVEHFNEKLRRIHLENMGAPRGAHDSGHRSPEIDHAPFLVSRDLTYSLEEAEFGSGWVGAVPTSRLVEPAVTLHGGTALGMFVPNSEASSGSRTLEASFSIGSRSGGARTAPEWIHVRTQLINGVERDLNLEEEVTKIVENGRVDNVSPYQALHYLDFTGDGWVEAQVSGAAGEFARSVPAYSVVAVPDFYPYVNQSELVDWWIHDVPSTLRATLWAVPPLALSDHRLPPNLALRLHGAPFVPEDTTITALVGLMGSSAEATPTPSSKQVNRISSLPDSAAGIFAPGWDTSIDRVGDDGPFYLAAHGLGSPFPEDAKLCAAISAFWPAASPDTSRSYGGVHWRIVAPMTDRETGIEDAPPWDGVPGIHQVEEEGVKYVEHDHYPHVDYVRTALDNRFTLSETIKVDQRAYQSRVLANARMFAALQQLTGSRAASMVSFREAEAGDPDVVEAGKGLPPMRGVIYRFVMAATGGREPLRRHDLDQTRWIVRAPITKQWVFLVDELGQVACKEDDEGWQTMLFS